MLLQFRFFTFLPLQQKGENSQFAERSVLAHTWAFGLKQGSPRQTVTATIHAWAPLICELSTDWQVAFWL